jgi:hypothetical protein
MARVLVPTLVAVLLLATTVMPIQSFGAVDHAADTTPWLGVPQPADNDEPITHIRSCAAVAIEFARCHAHLRTDARVRGKVPARVAAPTATMLGNSGAYDPSYLRSAYNLAGRSSTAGAGETVAIIDAYDAPNAESDVGHYRGWFGLPACTAASSCLRKVNQDGAAGPYPAVDPSWAEEISLDLDMVSAICPRCSILLVEANSSRFADLATAVKTAASMGASAISNSYGGPEWSGEGSWESFYNHPGIAVTASAGDTGYGVEFPAAARYTVAVGGTSLRQSTNTGSRNATETAWSGTGSGCSAYIPKPHWQHDAGCARRTVSDVAAVADPSTGVWVYDSTPYAGQSGWIVLGGTSVASPIVASVAALSASRSIQYASGLYPAPAGSLFDITSGSNGTCGGTYLCTGEVGYDGPTGNGTPNDVAAFAVASSAASTPTATSTSRANSATFAGQDTATRGSWKGVYGSQGYWLEGDGQSPPAYALVSSAGAQTWTWAASTSDIRGLQKAASQTDRLAAAWYHSTSFTQDVNLTDGQSHALSVYALDWDHQGRAQTIDVVDASTGAVLDSRTASTFQGGIYLTWAVKGHVQLHYHATAGPNPVVSALFLDAPRSRVGSPTATPTSSPTATPSPSPTTSPTSSPGRTPSPSPKPTHTTTPSPTSTPTHTPTPAGT